MEIELGPLPRFENIRSNAYWSRVHLDTRLCPDFDNIEQYRKHISDCYNHPTTGMLAKRKYITSKPMNYPINAKYNKYVMEMHPSVKELKNSFEQELKTLYPRTKHIRQYIIDNDRVVLDFVERAKKYTLVDKFAILLKRFL